jgi:hypothetical protein
VTETLYLRKDKPDPVTGLSSGSEFIKDCLINTLLRIKKALEIIFVSHGLNSWCNEVSGSAAFSKTQNVAASLLGEGIEL